MQTIEASGKGTVACQLWLSFQNLQQDIVAGQHQATPEA